MTCTWVICGAGSGVGKTHVAQELCKVLPDAVYAKSGCGQKDPAKPQNFFSTEEELTSFIQACRGQHRHIVVESNALARRAMGDIIIFVGGTAGRTDFRTDTASLQSKAHLSIIPGGSTAEWERVLREKLPSIEPRDGVRKVLQEHALYLNSLAAARPDSVPHRPGASRDGVDESIGTSGLREVDPIRIAIDSHRAVQDHCVVVVEELVTLMVDQVGSFAIMCTPCDVKALAIGFAFTEGMIESIGDVAGYCHRPNDRVVAMRVDDPQRVVTQRNLIVTSSCGLCGSRNIDSLLSGHSACGDSLRVPCSLLPAVVDEMRSRQVLFERTGGTHAAAIFDGHGKLVAFGEDIGRHNALDKAIGERVICDMPLAGHGVVLSGRVSLELVAKAVRAGLEVILAVSAPSSLAIQAADRWNITLCGFVRGQRATVYTHPKRIEGVASET
ncbi:MAG TPA: formate dehydrogenase accessory sulfurtransferase FdhD [Phycisphaerae bacterium]|nr:formate dehydrogenase accessory sulfurtransferase FdhD [Phycisphaerae bacterium]